MELNRFFDEVVVVRGASRKNLVQLRVLDEVCEQILLFANSEHLDVCVCVCVCVGRKTISKGNKRQVRSCADADTFALYTCKTS